MTTDELIASVEAKGYKVFPSMGSFYYALKTTPTTGNTDAKGWSRSYEDITDAARAALVAAMGDDLPVMLSNGGKVLERTRLPDARGCQAAEIVLCHISHNSHHPYATWQRNIADGAGGCYWGHYFDTEEKARADYSKRVAEKLNEMA